MAARDDADQTHHHGLGEDTHHGEEGNHDEDEDKCREVGGDNPHGKEDTHEVDIRRKGGDARDEKSGRARHVDETHHESRNRTRACDVGDDATEGKSVRTPVRQRDTRAHGGDIYAREKTLVHRDLDKERDRLEEVLEEEEEEEEAEVQGDQGGPASHHAPEDREGQEGHYRQEGQAEAAGAGVEAEAEEGAEGAQMTAGEAEEAEEAEDHRERACHGHELYGQQTQGEKP